MEMQDNTMQELARLAREPAAQKLMELLRSSGGDQLRSAMDKASKGNYADAKEAISSLLAQPEAQALLRQLGGK